MVEGHWLWFKFGGGANSLLWVGHAAGVHDAVVGSNHLAVVTDVEAERMASPAGL